LTAELTRLNTDNFIIYKAQSRRFPLARTSGHVTLSLRMRETATG